MQNTCHKLWFAWKIVLLQYHKQLRSTIECALISCDLLEKSYFCSITNNHSAYQQLFHGVVICLKNRTFAVSQTTAPIDAVTGNRLWFAWKIVLLQYHKQQAAAEIIHNTSCDLLEKSYFCSITNNRMPSSSPAASVVICLKNRTFAVSQTTQSAWQFQLRQLWFAWKIVLLQYHKQP